MQFFKSISSRISTTAAILVLVAFFLPWITVSCSGTSETVTGYDLAVGSKTHDAPAEVKDRIGADPKLWLIPLAAVAVLGVVYLRSQGRFSRMSAAVVYAGAGLLGLALHIIKYFAVQSDLHDAEKSVGKGMIDLSYKSGWWLSILALLAILGAAYWAATRETGEGETPPPVIRPPL